MIDQNKMDKAKQTKGYLIGKTVLQKEFVPTFTFDYAVCAFCWSQFSGFEEDLHEGFWESESDTWICPRCLDRFADGFQWDVRFKSSGIDLLPYDREYFD
jgi:hypothetical protein